MTTGFEWLILQLSGWHVAPPCGSSCFPAEHPVWDAESQKRPLRDALQQISVLFPSAGGFGCVQLQAVCTWEFLRFLWSRSCDHFYFTFTSSAASGCLLVVCTSIHLFCGHLFASNTYISFWQKAILADLADLTDLEVDFQCLTSYTHYNKLQVSQLTLTRKVQIVIIFKNCILHLSNLPVLTDLLTVKTPHLDIIKYWQQLLFLKDLNNTV